MYGEEKSMLKVFICEDNIKQKDRFIKIINNIILIENYDMEIELWNIH